MVPHVRAFNVKVIQSSPSCAVIDTWKTVHWNLKGLKSKVILHFYLVFDLNDSFVLFKINTIAYYPLK